MVLWVALLLVASGAAVAVFGARGLISSLVAGSAVDFGAGSGISCLTTPAWVVLAL